MFTEGLKNLETIHFEWEMLPCWAQLLDLAAVLGSVPSDTRRWFSMLTKNSGVEDGRVVIHHCQVLREGLEARREATLQELARTRDDEQPSRIFAGWVYSLDTMIGAARGRKTCSWTIADDKQSPADDAGGGDITLRRV
ncbi:MAG TPA: hypothetical protein VHH73_02380 [Verrucomicrobiae bacterium]|nr:hypothetical protein [Verrucomicrobiae bacterium]